MGDILPSAGVRLGGIGNPDTSGPSGGRRLAALFFHHFDVMGDLGRVNFSMIGFKPNLAVICSDSRGRNAIQELVQGEELRN